MAELSNFGRFFVNRSNERNSRQFFETVSGLLKLDAGSSCVELGSGRGFLSYLVFDHYRPSKLVVTDYDPSQTDEAKRFFERRLGPIPENIEFQNANALELPFENESFDAVFAMQVLHHTENRDWQFRNIPRALREIRRVLRNGGIFCYTEMFNKNRIRDYLASAGFQKVLTKRHYFVFDSCVYRKADGSF